jgi:hypothetical protein
VTAQPEPRYRLGRRELRGAVFGWRVGQAAAIAMGAALLVVGVDAGGLGVALGVVAVCAGIVVATVPVRGRGLDEWAPVAACHLVRVRGRSLAEGACIQPADGDTPACVRWPDGRATVLVSLRHRGLRALADEPVALGEAVATWLRDLSTVGAPQWSVSMLSVTGRGIAVRGAQWADAGVRTRSFLAVSDAEPVRLAELLAAAGVAGVEALSGDELFALLAERVAPAAGTILDCDLEVRWHGLVGPASVHAAYLVEEWPSGDVDEQFLSQLCISRDRRTLCVTLRVEELGRARSRTARVRTGAKADETMVEEAGFLASPQAARDSTRDLERANELAGGHGSVRLVGAVSVDAHDLLELEAAAARLVADATSCGIRLRRCDGDHGRGVLATVPGWCVP